MADVITSLGDWVDLSPKRRQTLVSCLTTAVRMSGLPPASLTLTPAVIRERILDRSAAGHGVRLSTMRNIQSSLRFVMRRFGIIEPSSGKIDEAWAEQLALLPTLRRGGMIAFARFCFAHVVAPEAVTVETVNDFEAHLVARTLVGRPSKVAGDVRGAWNHNLRHFPGWAGSLIGPRRKRDNYVLPLSAFSLSFQNEVAAFGRRLAATELDDLGGSDVDEDGDSNPLPAKGPLRPSTVALRMDHARWAASALVASGQPITQITSLACLVTPLDRVRQALCFLRDRAGGRPTAAATHVAEVMRIVGKYEAGFSPKQLDKIKRWSKKLKLSYKGMTERNQREISDAMHPQRLGLLVVLPNELMSVAQKLRAEAPHQARTLALRAVAVGFLLKLPIRLGDLLGLRLDRHFHRPDPRRRQITHLMIPAEETKNDRAISMPIPTDVAVLIETWVTYRAVQRYAIPLNFRSLLTPASAAR